MKLVLLAVLATILLAPQLLRSAEMLEPGHPGPHDGHARKGIINIEDPDIGDRNRARNPDYSVVLTGSEIPSYLMLDNLAHQFESMGRTGGADALLRWLMQETESDATEAQAIIDTVLAAGEELADIKDDNKRRALCHVSDAPTGVQIYDAFEHLQSNNNDSQRATHAKLNGQLGHGTFLKVEFMLDQLARGTVYAIPDDRQRKTVAEAEEYVARACAKLGLDYSEVGQ